jgi:hypothetical protein
VGADWDWELFTVFEKEHFRDMCKNVLANNAYIIRQQEP